MIHLRSLRKAPAIGLSSAVLLTGAAFAVTAEPANALTNCTISDAEVALDAEEQAFLGIINNYRAQYGLGPLTISTNLNRAAAWMARDMGQKAYFSHTDSLGRSPSDRAQNCGYPGGAGENIAAGTVKDTAQEAFEMWRDCPGHNENMLNRNYRTIGIARAHVAGSPYGWYWVTNFGLTNDGTGGGTGGGTTPTPTPTPTPPPPPPPTQAPTYTEAQLTSPSPGSTLPGSQTTFSWSAGTNVREYFIYVGTSQGSNNIVGKSMGMNRSATVINIPTDGQTIHVRLWTRFDNGWQYTDYSYRAASKVAQPAPTRPTFQWPTYWRQLWWWGR